MNNNKIVIHRVFSDTSLCQLIFKHSVIKGKELLDRGDLKQMLKYNATQYFITEYDRVAPTYPPNIKLLTHSIKYNNQRVFDHLLHNTNMSIPMKCDECYSDDDKYIDVITAVVTGGNMYMLQTYLDMTGHGIIRGLTPRQLVIAINHNNEHFVRLLLQHSILEEFQFNSRSLMYLLTRPCVRINMLRLLNEEFGTYRLLDDPTIWLTLTEKSVVCNMAQNVQYLLDHIPTSLSDSSEWSSYIQKCYCHENLDTLKVILEHPGVNGASRVIDTRSLEEAMRSGQAHIMKYLIDSHMDIVSDALSKSMTLVEMAMNYGQFDMVDLLLDQITHNTNAKFAKQYVNHLKASKVPLSVFKRIASHPNIKLVAAKVLQGIVKVTQRIHFSAVSILGFELVRPWTTLGTARGTLSNLI
ncbi:hypothetical protein SAMD00019534_113680 [Acytostelium subglobosum LB1]|uniref:hypothetical protein n=1 Tax=Acytostelium subglobosum LB1 TaxID=1410327 RepID=UPI000644F807|nr:hypothetical protein SAMD00019534_113680 [Acytostelium subglobosum LB1]GAM28192.1 hypothetical protein SAMD00019534_113680 [Acytostelium subglobosum LB1]|eukprot:XP_012748826.1 hypothetical protein SAMD00019534_113680 [Acytostelium subglobosum LB1]